MGVMKWLKRPVLAMQLLTRIPIRVVLQVADAEYGKCAVAFPLVGLVLGSVCWLVWWIVHTLTGMPWIAMLAAMATEMLLTGGFHLDGLADTADGLMSGRSPERMLEIMKDSRIGTMGVLALWFMLLARWILLVQLADIGVSAVLLLIAPPILARLSIVSCAAPGKYARENGLGRATVDEVKGFEWVVAILIAALLCLPFMGLWTLFCLPVAVVTGALVCHRTSKKLGGITGDSLGAASEWGHNMVLLALAVAWHVMEVWM